MGTNLISAGVAGIGSLLGGIFGGQGQTTSNTSTSSPWDPQQPYLKAGMADAAFQYANQRGTPYYTGNTYAQMDPHTQSSLNGIYGYQGQGALNSSNMTSSGQNLVNAGNSGVDQSIHNLNNFNPQDPTQQNIQNAGMYANNPYVDGMVNAASRDVTRNLSEVALPGIARNASGTGNMDSTRTSIAEGIAQRGAQDQIGDISANLRGQQYSNGLQLSEQARQANQGNYLDAISRAGQIGTGAAQTGYSGIGQGQGLYYNNMDAQTAAGQLSQQNQQGILNQGLQQWQNNQSRPWQLLGNYMGAITGAGTYPSTTGTNTQGGGIGGMISGALGGAATGLGLYQKYQAMSNPNSMFPSSNGLY